MCGKRGDMEKVFGSITAGIRLQPLVTPAQEEYIRDESRPIHFIPCLPRCDMSGYLK